MAKKKPDLDAIDRAMARKVSTGGPAFPRPASEFTLSGTLADGNDAIPEQDGMSLRDYFAAAVLPAILRSRVELGMSGEQASIATESYEIADAMLKARLA